MGQTSLPNMDIDSWRERSAEEVNFWENWIFTERSRWPQEYKRRTDPTTPMAKEVENFLDGLGLPADRTVKILDIGAGPLSFIGTNSEKYTIDLTVVDPLAEEYNRLLDQKNVTGVPRPERGYFETATTQFGAEAFDLVWSRNSLDHALDPVLGLFNLLNVCRIGGGLLLSFHPNEAEGGNYAGLHQWNLDYRDGEVVLSQKDRMVSLMPLLQQQKIVSISQPEKTQKKAGKGRVNIKVEKIVECNLSQCLIA